MLRYLDVMTMLFESLVSGLYVAKDKIKSIGDDAVVRKIIQIQQLLEDIIENAREQINIIKKMKQINELDTIKPLLSNQMRKINYLHDLFFDDDTKKLYRCFSPDTRRKIIDIFKYKLGALNYVIQEIDNLAEQEIKNYIKDFDAEHIFKGIKYQEEMISKLEECSIKIADYISKQFDIREISKLLK